MKQVALILFAFVVAASAASAQEVSKEEIVKLKKAGADDAALLKAVRAAGKKFDLSTDDVVNLVATGVSEEVINAMLRGPDSPSGDRAKDAAGRKTGISVENRTSGSFWASLDARRKVVRFASTRAKGMQEVRKGERLGFDAVAGDYGVEWRGACVCLGFGVSEGKVRTLLVREEADDEGCMALWIEVAKDGSAAKSADALYVCPMHPAVTSKEPGKCPKCGMKLEVPQAKPSKEKETHAHDHPKG